MVKLFIPFNVCLNMILITYRLGSWKKALELNKVKHKPFYKWPQFRLERMQMTAEDSERNVWFWGNSGDGKWLIFNLGTLLIWKERVSGNADYTSFEVGTYADACAFLLKSFLPQDRVVFCKMKSLSGQTPPSVWKTVGLHRQIGSFETFFP